MNPSEEAYGKIVQCMDEAVNGPESSPEPSMESVGMSCLKKEKQNLAERRSAEGQKAVKSQRDDKKQQGEKDELELAGTWKYYLDGQHYELNFFALLNKTDKTGRMRLNQDKFKV